jgi:hypothetical protein
MTSGAFHNERATTFPVAAVGTYGATLPLTIVALGCSSADLAAALQDAALAVERVERQWHDEFRGLELALGRLGGGITSFAARHEELARYARSLPDAVASRDSLEERSSRLGGVVGALVSTQRRLQEHVEQARGAVDAQRAPIFGGGTDCVALAATAAEDVQRAIEIGHEIVEAGQAVAAALKKL